MKTLPLKSGLIAILVMSGLLGVAKIAISRSQPGSASTSQAPPQTAKQPNDRPVEVNYYYPTATPPAWFQELATITVIVFTGGLWLTSCLQWRAIRDQAKAASKTFLLQFRPKLIVRNVIVHPIADAREDEARLGAVYYFVRHELVTGQFYVANVGDSPATITESLCMVHWRQGDLPMRRPYEGQDGNNPISGAIQPGERRTALFQSDKTIDINSNLIALHEQPKNILPADKDWNIYVMGWVEYADNLGFVRRTAFCRRFDGKTHRFVAVDDPDYEHAE